MNKKKFLPFSPEISDSIFELAAFCMIVSGSFAVIVLTLVVARRLLFP